MGNSIPFAPTLDDLLDVELAAPGDGDALTFNEGTELWTDREAESLVTPPNYFRSPGRYHYAGAAVTVNSATTVALFGPRLYAVPIWLPRRTSIGGFCFRIGGAPAGNIRAGLYENAAPNDPRPGGLVREFGQVAAAPAGMKGGLLDPVTVVIPGLYWATLFLSVNNTTYIAQSSKDAAPFMGSAPAAGNVPADVGDAGNYVTADLAYGPLPDPFPPIGGLGNSFPLIGLLLDYP